MNANYSRSLIVLFLGILVTLALLPRDVAAEVRDLMSDTWAATDQIGRSLSMHEAVGEPREDRHVAIFYFLWLGHHPTLGPYDMTRIREENSDNPQWGPLHSFHWWSEPELGYYLSADEYVIRKHVNMLTNAGVDALFFDVTNAVLYTHEYMTLLEVMEEIRQEGGETPKVAFFAHQAIIQDIYEELYQPGLYPEHWFYWDGRPLMIRVDRDYPSGTPGYDAEVEEFFTLRNMWGLRRITEPEIWSFLQFHPQDLGYTATEPAEFMLVSTAQQETYMSAPTAHGKHYHNGQQPPESEWDFQHHNFAEQFEHALEADPRLIFITGWNEWVAQRFEDEQGNTRFTDAWSIEFNRDIEPMKGGYTDTQYYQMVDFIRRYKGVRSAPIAERLHTIALDGDFSQWEAVATTYHDHRNDTAPRDNPGWNNVGPYVNETGRNDFVTLKTATDTQNLYFYAECAEFITPHTDPHWMLLFINSDNDPDSGWHGYNYVLSREMVEEGRSILQRSTGGWNWEDVGEIDWVVEGNKLALRIPRSWMPELGARFEFKWADNIQEDDKLLAFSLYGDAAPDRRFNYVFEIDPALLEGQFPVDLTELMTVIQLFNAGEYYCDAATASGYSTLAGDRACTPHPADTREPDWEIGISELLRWVQFYNSGGYHVCDDPHSEDGYCPGL